MYICFCQEEMNLRKVDIIMKKTWENAEMEALEIKETAGGNILNMQQDGDIWWNEERGEYELPLGEDIVNS